MDHEEQNRPGRGRKGGGGRTSPEPGKPAQQGKTLTEKALAQAARQHRLKNPLLLDSFEAQDPESGRNLTLFRVADHSQPNGPSYALALDERGEPARLEASRLEQLSRRGPAAAGPPAALAAVTITPDTNTLTLNPGQTFTETITVTIPKNAGPVKADVYFLADTTGSMGSILSAVQAGANGVLAALNGLGVDLAFGVGNYKDFLQGDPYAFQHQLSPTQVVANITAAINSWTASGGGDLPEGQLFALDSLAVPPGGTIGWRAGSKRIIVWFGDAAGHDPICAAVSGTGADITEASATAKLVAQGITVLAISTAKPGLDEDPKLSTGGYAPCGPAGGSAGQGTRIASQTGGVFVTGINAGNIANTITSLVSGAVSGIQNVKLVPSPSVAPFVSAINPPGGYGPLSGDQDHTLTFRVTFTGLPCKPDVQVITGTLDVVADGSVVAAKKVQITVPACAERRFVYAVKFVCGEQPEEACEGCAPVRPGRYATQISIHNITSKEVEVVKRFIPVVLSGVPVGREPRVAAPRAEDKIVLPAHNATMDDCCRIAELLYGAGGSSTPLTVGFLEITASAEVAVTAIYTTGGSIRVEQVLAGR